MRTNCQLSAGKSICCVVYTLDPGFLVQFSRIFCRRAKHLWGISLNKIRILRHILFVLAGMGGLGRQLALVSQASFTLHTFDILPPVAAEAAQPSSLFMFCSFNTWKHQTRIAHRCLKLLSTLMAMSVKNSCDPHLY